MLDFTRFFVELYPARWAILEGVGMTLTRKDARWSALSDCPTAGTVTVNWLVSLPSAPAGAPSVAR